MNKETIRWQYKSFQQIHWYIDIITIMTMAVMIINKNYIYEDSGNRHLNSLGYSY